jgi:protein-disulfide isomerase
MASLKRPATLVEKLIPVLMLASIGLAFLVGVLWQKVQTLESGGSVKSAGTQVAGADTNPQAPSAGLPNTVTKLSDDQAKKVPGIQKDDYVRGDRNAEIFLIEYSDLECPFCKRFHETAKQVVTNYKGQVAWVYRHYPIEQLHSKALKETEAVECANEIGGQDAFWKLTDKIYEVTPANNGLDLATLPSLAASVGINEGRFKTCLDSGKYKEIVAKRVAEAIATGASGTPANFVINKKGEVWIIPGALPLENVKTVIDEALAS